MENFSDKLLYVDVDETLVFWSDPLKPYHGSYTVNTGLVRAVRKVIEDNVYSEVIIWSGGGKPWADTISKLLFLKYKLRSLDKFLSYRDVPDNAYAVDDRLQPNRYYLSSFIQVFSPSEFEQGVAF
jgi:hypothetical protein|tara:strand:+ start:94 stop:471 length:378 start_codon:yes stop_codon:yes gene_type:complete